MTRTQVLQIFDRIRVWQQGDKRAPHKPLLILLALGRLQRGEVPVVEFSQIDAPLKTLIDEFGPSGAGLPDSFTLVFSQQVAGGEATKNTLLAQHGNPLIKPQSREYLPAGDFLAWHGNEVFKRPQRQL